MPTDDAERDASEVMAGPGRRCFVETGGAWRPTGVPGLTTIPIARRVGPSEARVALFRLAPGAALPLLPTCREAVVLDGTLRLPDGDLDPLGYARRSAGDPWTAGSSGCELFVRDGIPADPQNRSRYAPFAAATWLAGHGNLTVRPLHTLAGETESTALVHWPRGERFVPHRHFGGEEIFVLSGTFRDEHGNYPARTWMLSGHLSVHYPFVEEPTLIFVKTGHLPPR
jgi:quercetin dioxygenase-like cupin family protein